MSEKLLVLQEGTTQAGVTRTGGPATRREYAIVKHDDPFYYGVEVDNRPVGVMTEEANVFGFELEGELYVIIAGVSEVHHVRVASLTELQTCHVKNNVWMTFPKPFMPGTKFTVSYHDKDDRELSSRKL